MGIARGLGRPIKVDLTTLNFERARFARICVEVDLQKPLKGSVRINDERYFVAYEGLNHICSGCGLYGHWIHSCPQTVLEKEAGLSQTRSTEIVVREEIKENEGFTEVRRGRRRSTPPYNSVVFTAGGSSGGPDRDLREIKQKDSVNIEVSNSFGNLEIEEILPTSRKVTTGGGANKENVFRMQLRKGKSVEQGRDLREEWVVDKGRMGRREGRKESKAQSVRNGGSGPQGQQNRTNRPVRGLVFGQSSGEQSMTANGKRLRVEKGHVGREGGAFMGSTDVNLDGAGAGLEELTRFIASETSSDFDKGQREVEMQRGEPGGGMARLEA